MKLKEIYRKDIIDKFIQNSQISSLISNNNNVIEQHTNLSSQQICAIIAKRSKYNNTIVTSKKNKNKRKKLTTNNNAMNISINTDQTSSEIINTIDEDESFTFGFIINSNENN